MLPAFEDHDRKEVVTIKSGCSVSNEDLGSHWPPGSNPSTAEKPFRQYHKTDDKVFTITIQRGFYGPKLLFAIQTKILTISNETPDCPTPWVRWSEANAGCIWIPRHSVVTTYGERVAIASCNAYQFDLAYDGRWYLELLDFSRARVRRLDILRRSDPGSHEKFPSGNAEVPQVAPQEISAIARQIIWPEPCASFNNDNVPTLRNALQSPTEASSQSSADASLSGIRFLRTILPLPGSRRSNDDSFLEMSMDAERIILTMPHVGVEA
ncbi:hypothetical protein DL93DRAFT_499897 [Clavulina sp. PMI_390]|nr:hypothetical protein DL93DRAFT_499897 [Clavulina sp. PMI_390]